MKIYFLSSRPCALRLNGAFFGMTDRFERFAHLQLSDRIYAEFLPEGALPIGCFLTEELRFSPPENCEVYLIEDGIALYARDFPPVDLSLSPIAQLRKENCLATVFRQGAVQLSLQTPDGFFTSTLPPSFSVCELFFENGLLVIHGQNQLAVYTKTGERLLLEEVLSFDIKDGVLRARLPLSERLGRVADCAWTLSETACTRTEFTLKQFQTDKEDREEELLAFAFFESVLIGAEYADMLSDELQPKADSIRAFLGDFESVVLTDDPMRCGLVRKKAERLFEVSYYRVTVEKDKITDITA